MQDGALNCIAESQSARTSTIMAKPYYHSSLRQENLKVALAEGNRPLNILMDANGMMDAYGK